ncbi:winged helix-turn-helix domain-containing protein [Candidatus Bathyarchaeota archaeon]|nr:winged helix-turn-helix domain-containing protein [Candidatus Bathyarchaeota archaeon]
MGKRSKIKKIFQTLKIIDSGTDKPTRIMARANLNFVAFRDVLNLLERKEYVSYEYSVSDNRRTYRLTDKGQGIMEMLGQILTELELS